MNTGFKALDAMMQGFHDGELFVMGGHKGVGVEACVSSLLQHVSEQKKRVLLCSATVFDTEHEVLNMHGLNLAAIKALIRFNAQYATLDMMIIHGLDDISTTDKREAWDEVLMDLKAWAGELKIPVVLTAVLSRTANQLKLGDDVALNFLMRQRGIADIADRILLVHQHDFLQTENDLCQQARKGWVYLVPVLGFEQHNGTTIITRKDTQTGQLYEMENQQALHAEIEQSVAQAIAEKEELEKQAQERKRQEMMASLPERMEALEEQLEEAISMVESVAQEIEALKEVMDDEQ